MRVQELRWSSVIGGIAVLSCVVSGVSTAVAAEGSNASPATATTIGQLPYVEVGVGGLMAETTDPAARMVADRCSGGARVYDAGWSKYTAGSQIKVLAEAKTSDSTWGGSARAAIVSGDLTSVLACSDSDVFRNTARTTPVTVSAGQTVYTVRYALARGGEPEQSKLTSVLTSTSGVAPANDSRADATAIGTIPFTQSFDTTMAAHAAEDDCERYESPVKDVWWTYTPTVSGTYRARVTSTAGPVGLVTQVYDTAGDCVAFPREDAYLEAGKRYLIQVNAFNGYYDQQLPTGGQGTLTLNRVDTSPPVWTRLPTTSVPVGAVLTSTASPCRSGVHNSTLPVAIDYSAADPQSGVSSYVVDGASVGTATRVTATAYEDDLACGGTSKRRSFEALNRDAYRSTAAQWSANRLAVVEDPNLTYNGAWSTSSCTCWSAGGVRRTTSAGAAASFTVPALLTNDGGTAVNTSQYSLGLVMAKGTGRGKAAVYVDGVKVATVDTYSSTSVDRTVVWRTVVSPGRHTLRVVNLATAGRPRIDVDALVVVAK